MLLIAAKEPGRDETAAPIEPRLVHSGKAPDGTARWRRLTRTRRMAELTPFLRAPVVDDADLAINQKGSDNNEVRPRFSGRNNGAASSQSGRTYR